MGSPEQLTSSMTNLQVPRPNPAQTESRLNELMSSACLSSSSSVIHMGIWKNLHQYQHQRGPLQLLLDQDAFL